MRALLACLIFSFAAMATPPQVDWHFPMGAQRGTDRNAVAVKPSHAVRVR